MRLCGLALRHAADHLGEDLEVVRAAVRSCSFALEFAAPCVQTNRQFVFDLVTENGLAMGGVIDAHRNDREIVLAAVRDNWSAVADAGTELINDPRSIARGSIRTWQP